MKEFAVIQTGGKQYKVSVGDVVTIEKIKGDYKEGDKVTFGNQVIDVIHTPGHTPGHVVLFSEQARLAFVGDVLFNGAIGRTDFPQGDFNTLIASIKTKLWPLGSDVTFVPGHGPESTFGRERASNPFVADEMPLY